MAGFVVRRRHSAQELQVHDAELAKRAASALLAADEGIRAASEELGFAEAELGGESVEAAAAVIAAVRRHLTDAFRLNRLNHDASPGTPDEVRARTVLILRLCEWAEHVLHALTETLADRVAWSRATPEVIVEFRADVTRERAGIRALHETADRLVVLAPPRGAGAGLNADADADANPDADPQAHLSRVREARSALEAATASARDDAARAARAARATRQDSAANALHHAIDDADRILDAAREAVTGNRGWVGPAAQTRLAEAERLRIDLAQCLGSTDALATAVTATVTTATTGAAGATATPATSNQRHADRLLAMARRVAALAGESTQLARRDIEEVRARNRAESRPRRMSWA
ncbi:hypothetical protein [Agromyces salentinus]|uniref:CHAD domain-containing protein n=1 Tax=Agromyces salentinus TaxID=269421 RepID=A0ABN2ML28_9MICO|nr:hypothetical protein [Agromyces salentinus]